jgi:uncharacterized membrane protein YdjX (TVP38/TMEM64 family)
MKDKVRIILAGLLVVVIAGAFCWLLGTDQGRQYLDRERLHEMGRQFYGWVGQHPLRAPAAFVFLYFVLAILALPLWWLQILGGYGFGLYAGVFWCQIASSVAAPVTIALSRTLLGRWFLAKAETNRARVVAVAEKLGHNGLLVVMAVRLMHINPFGLSNYAMGLTRIRAREAFIGTLLGNIPAVAFYVGIGAGYKPWKNWHFTGGLALVNILLLIPLALRYYKPQWFQRIGLE